MCRPATLLVSILAILIPAQIRAAPIQLPDGRSVDKIDFERHVHALLDRQGCNAGNCHGNRAGRGGFSLSLLATTPAADHAALVRTARGRYLNVADPERSLLLLKATGEVKHEGGMRVTPGSWEYQLLKQWIADGAANEPGRGVIKGLQVVPAEHVFMPDESVQLKVFAQFTDGAKEDVTPFCDFRLGDDEPVRVSATGKVDAVKPGDVGVHIFYRGRSRVMRAMVAIPIGKGVTYPKVSEVNFIDTEVLRQLRRLEIVPSSLSRDEQFLRRVTIDTIGTLPTPDEVRAFLASKDPDKRTKKIDELLAHPLHAAFLATRFCESTGFETGINAGASDPHTKVAQMAHGWYRKRLHENMPYDRLVQAVLTATSKEGRDGKTWFMEKADLVRAETGFGGDYAMRSTLDLYWRNTGPVGALNHSGHSDPPVRRFTDKADAVYMDNLAERTALAFLGIHLECARCHDHPLDGWTPADHRAFANVFAQVGMEEVPLDRKLPFNDAFRRQQAAKFARAIYLGDPHYQHRHPETGLALKPRLLGGPEVDFQEDARQALVRWMTHRDNPFFARHFVNSTWEHYFGIGLTEATDSISATMPSAQTGLLDRLAEDFIAHKFDIRRLERTILLSRTYQLAGANEGNRLVKTNFAWTVPRRFSPRVAGATLHAALETREDFGPGVPAGLYAVEVMQLDTQARNAARTDAYEDRISLMMHRFGRLDLVSRCERREPNLAAYLHYMGSSEVQALFEKSPRVKRLAQSKDPVDDLIDECFLAVLSKLPDAKDRKFCVEYLQREPTMRVRNFENVLWALTNTKEFLMRQ